MNKVAEQTKPSVIDVDALALRLDEAVKESAVALTIFKGPGEIEFHVGRSQNGRIEDLTRWAGCKSMLDLDIILQSIGTIYSEMLRETHYQIEAIEFAKGFAEKIRQELISVGIKTMARLSEAGDMK